MTPKPSLPSYADVGDLLAAVASPFHPAELHGFCCGHICATSGKMDHRLEKSILGKNKNPKYRESLQQLYEISYHQMSEFSFEFALLLPDDDININARTEALSLWCQGFLTGLKKSNVPIENREESDVTETINDILEIAQVKYGDIAEDDEDETAYFELIEYVRLGVLMIFQDLKNNSDENTGENNDTYH